MISHNWQWKLVALFLSFLLWYYVNTQRNPKAEQTYSIPIVIMNPAPGTVSSVPTQTASVRIEGSKTVVDRIRSNDIYAWVDLDNVAPPNGPIKIYKTVNVRIPSIPQEDAPNMTVSPKSVEVQVELVGGKKLPVEVKFLSTPPLGFSYGDPEVDPASISVFGKSESVSRVKKVVLTLSQNSTSSPIDAEFPLVAMDANGNQVKDVKVSPPVVRLKLSLIEVPASKEVVISWKQQGNLKPTLEIKKVVVQPPSVKLEGRPNVLSAISGIDTEPINVEGQDKTLTRQVKLLVPSGIKLKGPDTVSITVEIGPKQELH